MEEPRQDKDDDRQQEQQLPAEDAPVEQPAKDDETNVLVVVPVPDHRKMIRTPGMEF